MWGDDARDNMFAGLQSLGVNARMADRGRPEEGEGSMGIIDIVDEPISWVSVGSVTSSQVYVSTDDYTHYGVKVSYRITLPITTIRSVRRKNFPLLGKVIDAGWTADWWAERGSALVADVLRRLREDAQVREAVIATRDVTITGHSSFWVVATLTGRVPTRQEWDCYQAIARHLIEAG